MKLALIKTSSMGDVIHALPVVTDIVRALPEAEIAAARRRLRDAGYDLALDLQGLVKSAWVARMTGAPIAGFSRRCAREPLAALAYRQRHDVDLSLHAIERLRTLAGAALGYAPQGLPSFGLIVPTGPAPGVPAQPYAMLLHATSRADKQWPDPHWLALIAALSRRGIVAALPWGSQTERARAERLAAEADGEAIVLPRLSLRECAAALAGAQLVVGVDTGLTHLSAALDAPTVALFAATPAWRFGPYWTPRAIGLGEAGHWPDPTDVLAAADRVLSARA